MNTIHVSCLDIVPGDVVGEFADSLRGDDLDVSLEVRPNTPQASVEWLVPTAVAVFIAHKYIGTMLELAAKDHYEALKKGIMRLVSRTTGKGRDVKVKTVGTEGKALDPDPMVLSVYVELTEGRKAKFCFEHRIDEHLMHPAVTAMIHSMVQYHAGAGQSHIALEENQVTPGDWKPILLRFDEESHEWLVWHWKPPSLDLNS